MSRGHVSGNLQAGVQPLQAFPTGQSLNGYAEHVYQELEGEPPIETNAIRQWRDWPGLRNGQLELRLNNQRAPRVHGLGWGFDPDAGVWRPVRVDSTGALVVAGGPAPPEPAPPQDGLIGWWRADDVAQADGTDVDTWTDRSGNTGALVRVPSLSGPIYTVSEPTLNNQPAVNFAGGVRQLWRVSPPNYPVGGQAFSVYVAHHPVFGGSVGTMFGWGQNYTPAGRMCLSLFAGSPWTLAADGYGVGTNGYVASSAPQITSVFASNNQHMQDAEIWVNGAVPGAPTGIGAAVPWNIPNPVPECRLGGLSQENSVSYEGKIAEVIVYHKHHNAAERAATLSYLSARYAIPV